MAKEEIISTFDPFKLETKLIRTGAQVRSFTAPAHNVFHINRIEDYVRMVQFPTETDVQPFRLTVFNFIFLTRGNSIRTKGKTVNQEWILPTYCG